MNEWMDFSPFLEYIDIAVDPSLTAQLEFYLADFFHYSQLLVHVLLQEL